MLYISLVLGGLVSIWLVKLRKSVLDSLTTFLLTEQVHNKISGASLVVQWLRIGLQMQEVPVRSLNLDDPTCHGTTEPVHTNCWACALEPGSHNYWAPVPWGPCCTREATSVRSPCAAVGKSPQSNKDPAQPKIKYFQKLMLLKT